MSRAELRSGPADPLTVTEREELEQREEEREKNKRRHHRHQQLRARLLRLQTVVPPTVLKPGKFLPPTLELNLQPQARLSAMRKILSTISATGAPSDPQREYLRELARVKERPLLLGQSPETELIQAYQREANRLVSSSQPRIKFEGKLRFTVALATGVLVGTTILSPTTLGLLATEFPALSTVANYLLSQRIPLSLMVVSVINTRHRANVLYDQLSFIFTGALLTPLGGSFLGALTGRIVATAVTSGFKAVLVDLEWIVPSPSREVEADLALRARELEERVALHRKLASAGLFRRVYYRYLEPRKMVLVLSSIALGLSGVILHYSLPYLIPHFPFIQTVLTGMLPTAKQMIVYYYVLPYVTKLIEKKFQISRQLATVVDRLLRRLKIDPQTPIVPRRIRERLGLRSLHQLTYFQVLNLMMGMTVQSGLQQSVIFSVERLPTVVELARRAPENMEALRELSASTLTSFWNQGVAPSFEQLSSRITERLGTLTSYVRGTSSPVPPVHTIEEIQQTLDRHAIEKAVLEAELQMLPPGARLQELFQRYQHDLNHLQEGMNQVYADPDLPPPSANLDQLETQLQEITSEMLETRTSLWTETVNEETLHHLQSQLTTEMRRTGITGDLPTDPIQLAQNLREATRYRVLAQQRSESLRQVREMGNEAPRVLQRTLEAPTLERLGTLNQRLEQLGFREGSLHQRYQEWRSAHRDLETQVEQLLGQRIAGSTDSLRETVHQLQSRETTLAHHQSRLEALHTEMERVRDQYSDVRVIETLLQARADPAQLRHLSENRQNALNHLLRLQEQENHLQTLVEQEGSQLERVKLDLREGRMVDWSRQPESQFDQQILEWERGAQGFQATVDLARNLYLELEPLVTPESLESQLRLKTENILNIYRESLRETHQALSPEATRTEQVEFLAQHYGRMIGSISNLEERAKIADHFERGESYLRSAYLTELLSAGATGGAYYAGGWIPALSLSAFRYGSQLFVNNGVDGVIGGRQLPEWLTRALNQVDSLSQQTVPTYDLLRVLTELSIHAVEHTNLAVEAVTGGDGSLSGIFRQLGKSAELAGRLGFSSATARILLGDRLADRVV